MDTSFFSSLLNITRSAALACYKHIGRGEAQSADQSAVSAMRQAFQSMPIKGQVVIGEGERDSAPMLYIGEKVGMWKEAHPEFDIAVDPLEGTNFCAKGEGGALSVLSLSEKGGLLSAPDIYMEKIACGPKAKEVIDLKQSPEDNIKAVAKALNKKTSEIRVVILNRPRHKKLVQSVYATGARVLFIEDGDLSASILTTRGEADLMMGTGGAPEGVLSASALKCLDGGFQGRLVFQNEGEKIRAKKMGLNQMDKIYDRDEIAKGPQFFCATGVTKGALLKGVIKTKQHIQTESLYINSFERSYSYVCTTTLIKKNT